MVHLHTHSMYSLRDSIIRPEDLITRLKEIGQTAVAITDHGGSLGGISLYKALKAEGIKYIHGCEFYICKDVAERDKNAKYFHLVVLCKNETGRRNMNKLISLSERPENRYVKPRIDFPMLSQYGEGLIVMSACLAGEVSRAIQNGDFDSAREIAQRYQSRFGNDFYLEIQAHNDPIQIGVNREILRIGQQLGISCVVTTDAHYTWENDKKYQNKYAFNGAYKEDGEAYIDCFVQSEAEVRVRLSYLDSALIDELLQNTQRVCEKCNVEMPLSAPIMPKVDTPPQYKSNCEWLKKLCVDGFKQKLNIDYTTRSIFNPTRFLTRLILDDKGETIGEEQYQLTNTEIAAYCDRYEYEMNALTKMGFVDYILLVYSYASVGKRRGIARGSGGGSLVNYLTDITNIDPVEHGLYFERFIDVGALSKLESGEITPNELKIPDIDLDFSKESCDEVLKFLYDTYGEDKVASIGKFGTNLTKGTIRDMCKVLDIDLAEADAIAKSFESYEIDEIDRMIAGELPISESAKQAIQCVERYPELFEYVRKLNGLPKSFGLHACGRIVSTRELDYYLPSCYDANGIRYLQGDMHDVEDVGLVKIDVLGLRTLDAEFDTLEQSGETAEFLNPKQPYTDDKVLDIFRKGDTVGVFQMASNGMKNTLKKMNVGGIDDLSVANALFRPGSLQYIDNYCRRKAGTEKYEYLHPDLEPILKSTYGIIVFQEQLIEIGRMAGIHNPDELRKATGKKNPAMLAKVKPELEEKLKARGWSDEQFQKLWSDMLEFARYSFNKCVSGDTKLLFPMSCKDIWYPTVEEMYLIRNDIEYVKHNNKQLPHLKYKCFGYGMALSMFKDGYIRQNRICDIVFQGELDCWNIKTKSGAYVTCTKNHKIPTTSGYKYADELGIGDMLFSIKGINSSKKRWLAANDPVVSIEYAGKQRVYDIEMADPAHNFVTDSGLVVCNSHSSAYAIISYMTAKQKTYYPAEFYCGLCNSYIGKSDFVKNEAQEIVSDMSRHHIKIASANFRHDHRRCSVLNGKVLWGIPLIRDCNTSLADDLYAMKDIQEPHFWRIVKILCDKGFKAKVSILIKLGFFQEYGTAKELLRIVEMSELFKMGSRKTIQKEKVAGSEFLRRIVERYSVSVNANGQELKTYKIQNCGAILDSVEDYIKTLNLGEFDLKSIVATQIEYIGALAIPTGKEEDRKKFFVNAIYPLYRKKDGKQFGYQVSYTSVGSGVSNSMSVYLERFQQAPIRVGDIILCKVFKKNIKNGRTYFTMFDYEVCVF